MLEQWNRKNVLSRQKKIYHRKKKKAEQIKFLWGFLFKCCIITLIEDCYEEVRDICRKLFIIYQYIFYNIY